MRPLTRATKADPAPSKWAWRLERLWLTPAFRRLLKFGLPGFVAVFALTTWLGDAERMQAVQDRLTEARRAIQDRPQFMVTAVSIEGASAQLRDDIAEAMPVDIPISQFALDTDALRAGLEELDPVARAEVRVAQGTLAIRITERVPAAIWVHADGTDVLDATGHRIATVAAAADAPGLPQLAGAGADARVAEALRLVEAAAPVADRLIGLVRMGERRWDVALSTPHGAEQRILLPERAPAAALDRALAMQAATGVLDRDVAALDLRLPDRPTLRLGPDAADAKLAARMRVADDAEDG